MRYTTQPINDVDVVVHVDFTDAPDIDMSERTEWHMSAGGDVCRWVAKTPGAMAGFSGILAELGEVPAWRFLADVANHAGYDVFDSDSTFEVYRRSTVSDTEQEGEEMPGRSVQDRIQREIDNVDERLRKNEAAAAELRRERDQLVDARNALGGVGQEQQQKQRQEQAAQQPGPQA
jgi:hypothetical protein